MENERRRMTAAERQNDIVEKTIQVLANGNYRSTTTAKIAHEAGVSEPVIYKHFSSKKELFIAALERVKDDILADWERVTRTIREPDSALRLLASYHYRFIQENKASEKILFQAVSEVDDPEVRGNLKSHFTSFAEFVADLIRRGKNLGVVNPALDDIMAAWVIISFSIGSGFLSLFEFDEELDRERLSQAYEILLSAFTV